MQYLISSCAASWALFTLPVYLLNAGVIHLETRNHRRQAKRPVRRTTPAHRAFLIALVPHSAGRKGSVSASMPSEEAIAASSSSRAITIARSVLLMDSALLYFGVLLPS